MSKKFDWIIIGAGSGGVRAARLAAQQGKTVGLIEQSALGGTCVNVGCIPKKLYAMAAQFSEQFEGAVGFGWSVENKSFCWQALRDHQQYYIRYLNSVYQRLLDQAGVTLLHGKAVFVDGHHIQVGDQCLYADKILLATGAVTQRLLIEGAELAKVSDQIFALPEQPERILIVGSGYIGLEFASIFAGLGTQVQLCFRQHLPLKGFDEDLRSQVAEQLQLTGIKLMPNNSPVAIQQHGEKYLVQFQQGKAIEYDQVLMATGRKPNTANLGLEKTGVELTAKGAIAVDDFFRSSVAHIYAIGDVIDRVALTPLAIAQAKNLMHNLHQATPSNWQRLDMSLVPTAVFSHPEIAVVGLTEQQAQLLGATQSYISHFRPLANGLSGSLSRCWMKMVVDKVSQRVLGLHMIGPHAAEIIQGFAVALTMQATKADFDRTLAIHPTLAEEWVLMR